jgi:hypothetical protein
MIQQELDDISAVTTLSRYTSRVIRSPSSGWAFRKYPRAHMVSPER